MLIGGGGFQRLVQAAPNASDFVTDVVRFVARGGRPADLAVILGNGLTSRRAAKCGQQRK